MSAPTLRPQLRLAFGPGWGDADPLAGRFSICSNSRHALHKEVPRSDVLMVGRCLEPFRTNMV